MPRRLLPLLVLAMFFAAPLAADEGQLDGKLREAMRDQRDVPGRTRALARLAWAEDTETEALAYHARKRLIEAAAQGMEAMTHALSWAETSRFADIMLASIEAEQNMTMGTSPHTIGAIDRCIWFGSPDAKRLAMVYMTRRPVHLLLLPVMDVAYEHPQLTPVVIDTLALMKDPKARFFLADQMQTGSPAIRKRAAEALSKIGGRGLEYLRAWALSEDPEMRRVALEALLPTAKVGDLTTLYEYLTLFPEDDPEVMAKLRARAELLEQAILIQEEMDARTPPLED